MLPVTPEELYSLLGRLDILQAHGFIKPSINTVLRNDIERAVMHQLKYFKQCANCEGRFWNAGVFCSMQCEVNFFETERKK